MDLDKTRIRLKPLEEIVSEFRKLVLRHRRNYLQRHLRACPGNCKRALRDGKGRATSCEGCGIMPDVGMPNVRMAEQPCRKKDKFVPLAGKDELNARFRERLQDPEVLQRDYRDITVFMWITGAFEQKKPDKTILKGVQDELADKKVVDAHDPDTADSVRDDNPVPVRNVPTGDSGEAEPNYNRAEANHSRPLNGEPVKGRVRKQTV